MLPEYQKHIVVSERKATGDKIKDSKREVLSDQDLFVCLSATFNIGRNL